MTHTSFLVMECERKILIGEEQAAPNRVTPSSALAKKKLVR